MAVGIPTHSVPTDGPMDASDHYRTSPGVTFFHFFFFA